MTVKDPQDQIQGPGQAGQPDASVEEALGLRGYAPLSNPRRPAGGQQARKVKDHRLTVSYLYYANEKMVPMIRLSGEWLKALGFDFGQKVIVRGGPGELAIRIAEEAAHEN